MERKRRGDVLRRLKSGPVDERNGLWGYSHHDDAASRRGASRYWEVVWGDGVVPGSHFDVGAPCACVANYLKERGNLCGGQCAALVPGCGRGYDCATLAAVGCPRVVGLDASASAIRAAERWHAAARDAGAYGPEAAVDLVRGDFFAEPPGAAYDVVVDVHFLSGLHPLAREPWAKKMGDLVKVGGEVLVVCPVATDLASFVAKVSRRLVTGPLYFLAVADVAALLRPFGFALTPHGAEPLPPDLAHRLPDDPAPSALAVFERRSAPAALAEV